MIGGQYWATGITVTYREVADERGPGWGARLSFSDDGSCNDDPDGGRVSTEGTLITRYHVYDGAHTSALSAVLDTLIEDAGRLGIVFTRFDALLPPMIYYVGDGESPDDVPPEGWRELLRAEADRLGWDTYAMAAPDA